MIHSFILIIGFDCQQSYKFVFEIEIVIQQNIEESSSLEGDCVWEGRPNHGDGAQHIWPQGSDQQHHH